jgi:hypothetical protein
MNRLQWWIDSGLAAQAAQELVWFFFIVFAVSAYAIWRDNK